MQIKKDRETNSICNKYPYHLGKQQSKMMKRSAPKRRSKARASRRAPSHPIPPTAPAPVRG